MTSFETLVLNPEATLIPVDALSPRSRARISSSGVSFVLSRPGTRSGALTLDQHGGSLVKLFQSPTTFPEALHALTKNIGQDSAEVVRSAIPLLKRLVKDQYLINHNPERLIKQRSLTKVLAVGSVFKDMEILERIQALDDTQVYKVKLPSGETAALKLLSKRHPSVIASFRREAIILEHLSGTASPKLIGSSLDGEDIFLLIEWIDGFSLSDWCRKLRNLPHHDAHVQLKQLSIDLLTAYEMIHSRGVLHSDVWMKNILIDRQGQLRVLDFGLAWFPLAQLENEPPIRAANPYFRAPDLAAAELAGTARPDPSIESEIYGLGAVLYMMMTGRSYVDFSLEQTVQMQEVMTKQMASFSERGVPSWPDYERLLEHMLAKDPQQRISSVAECLYHMNMVQIPQEKVPDERDGGEDVIPLLRSYVGDDLKKPFPAPSASLVYGSAGMGYAFLRAAQLLKDSTFLSEADFMLVRARESVDAGPEGSFCKELDITAEMIGPYSIHHRSEGVALAEALVAHTRNDILELRLACLRFLNGVHLKSALSEFAFGKAGLLNAILQLSFLVVENQSLRRVGDEVARAIIAELEATNDIKKSSIRFLGFAHGWAGILYSLLAWGKVYSPDLIAKVEPYLDRLAALKISSSLGAYWPKHFDRPLHEGDSASWCNGTAGFVLLWSEAFEATRDIKWLHLAEEAGRTTELHHEVGYNVCCGLAGRAFCLASLYRASQDPVWIARASTLLKRAKPTRGTHLHSLFKGITGLELARLELRSPEIMIFPTLASQNYGAPMTVGALG